VVFCRDLLPPSRAVPGPRLTPPAVACLLLGFGMVWVSFGRADSRWDRQCAGRMSYTSGRGLQCVRFGDDSGVRVGTNGEEARTGQGTPPPFATHGSPSSCAVRALRRGETAAWRMDRQRHHRWRSPRSDGSINSSPACWYYPFARAPDPQGCVGCDWALLLATFGAVHRKR